MATMNILKALRWGIQAWHIDLKVQSIERCFRKALKEGDNTGDISDATVMEITSGLEQLRSSSRISDLMDIQQFLNPVDEEVKDSLEQIDEQILAQYGPEIEMESDEEIELQPRITINEALEALNRLQLYEEQQEVGDTAFIQALNKQERLILSRRVSTVQQRDIRRYFV